MHEFSVCQALLDQVTEIAKQHAATKIVEIHITNGPLSGVDSTLLHHAFELCQQGTLAHHAALSISDQPLRVRCRNCQGVAEVAVNDWTCPVCRSLAAEVVSGDALILASLQLDIP